MSSDHLKCLAIYLGITWTIILTIAKEMGDRVVLEALVDPKHLMSKERKSDLLLHGGGEGLSPGAHTHTHHSFSGFHSSLSYRKVEMCKACPGNCRHQTDELNMGPSELSSRN